VLREADRIVCVHQAMADDLEALEPACVGKCRVITNGYDAEDFSAAWREIQPLDTGVCQLTHTGMAWGDAAMPLLRALNELKTTPIAHRLRVSFVGGLPPSSLQFIKDDQLDEVVDVQPRAPHQEALERMRQAHILLLLLVSNEGGRKWYPGKLFEYMVAGRPVLAVAPEGIATRLIRTVGIGLTVEPHETLRLVETLVEIATDVASFRKQHYHPNEAAIAQFNREALTQKLASVLDEVSREAAGA
jgi:glycosyltransferase involved in cell wall biosynthesis